MKKKINQKEFEALDLDTKFMIIEQVFKSEFFNDQPDLILSIPKRIRNERDDYSAEVKEHEDPQIVALVKKLGKKIFSENDEVEYDNQE